MSAYVTNNFFSRSMNRRLLFRCPFTHTSRPVAASMAAAKYRLTFVPGVGTSRCVPGSM